MSIWVAQRVALHYVESFLMNRLGYSLVFKLYGCVRLVINSAGFARFLAENTVHNLTYSFKFLRANMPYTTKLGLV